MVFFVLKCTLRLFQWVFRGISNLFHGFTIDVDPSIYMVFPSFSWLWPFWDCSLASQMGVVALGQVQEFPCKWSGHRCWFKGTSSSSSKTMVSTPKKWFGVLAEPPFFRLLDVWIYWFWLIQSICSPITFNFALETWAPDLLAACPVSQNCPSDLACARCCASSTTKTTYTSHLGSTTSAICWQLA